MSALVVLLFLIPGFVVEFIREAILWSKEKRRKDSWLFKILRGLSYNVPLIVFVWIVIYIWKVVLGMDVTMIQSLAQFFEKAFFEVFLLRYVTVYSVGIGIFTLGFLIYRHCLCRRHHHHHHHCHRPCHRPHHRPCHRPHRRPCHKPYDPCHRPRYGYGEEIYSEEDDETEYRD